MRPPRISWIWPTAILWKECVILYNFTPFIRQLNPIMFTFKPFVNILHTDPSFYLLKLAGCFLKNSGWAGPTLAHQTSLILRSFHWNRTCTEIFVTLCLLIVYIIRTWIWKMKMRGLHVRLGAKAPCLFHINTYNSTMFIFTITY